MFVPLNDCRALLGVLKSGRSKSFYSLYVHPRGALPTSVSGWTWRKTVTSSSSVQCKSWTGTVSGTRGGSPVINTSEISSPGNVEWTLHSLVTNTLTRHLESWNFQSFISQSGPLKMTSWGRLVLLVYAYRLSFPGAVLGFFSVSPVLVLLISGLLISDSNSWPCLFED